MSSACNLASNTKMLTCIYKEKTIKHNMHVEPKVWNNSLQQNLPGPAILSFVEEVVLFCGVCIWYVLCGAVCQTSGSATTNIARKSYNLLTYIPSLNAPSLGYSWGSCSVWPFQESSPPSWCKSWRWYSEAGSPKHTQVVYYYCKWLLETMWLKPY